MQFLMLNHLFYLWLQLIYKIFSKGLCSGLGKIWVSRPYVNSHFLQGCSLFKSCHTLYIHTVMINLAHNNNKCPD